jgi:DNA invertase Pin-like site-specific DNA recombinase
VNSHEHKVVGWARVSTLHQHEVGGGLHAQGSAIEAEAKRRGWELVGIAQDVASGHNGCSKKPRSQRDQARP